MEESGLDVTRSSWLALWLYCVTTFYIVSLSPAHRWLVTRKLTDMYWHNPDTRHTSSSLQSQNLWIFFILWWELLFSAHSHIFSHNKMPRATLLSPITPGHTRLILTQVLSPTMSSSSQILSHWPPANHLTLPWPLPDPYLTIIRSCELRKSYRAVKKVINRGSYQPGSFLS